ncbi:hypothetical protein [Paenibacillus sp. WLX2291]|uniref:hypothetical protein n=1 Tax=Paenibacillus sp. WLX2291 TaxID=3296934 RepID=UPI0039844441
MNLQELMKMPDRLSAETLENLFNQAIQDFQNQSNNENQFLEIIMELTDRQVMTYQLLDTEIRNTIDQILCSILNIEMYHNVDIILSIVINLGLENCFNLFTQFVESNVQMDKETYDEITAAIEEVGNHICNPYYDLEALKKDVKL